MQQIGVSTNGLNPKKLHIYGNGGNVLPVLNSDFRNIDLQENAIYIAGENDGVFNDNDYILFYGQGPHSWTADTDTQTATHHQNIFSDEKKIDSQNENYKVEDYERIQSEDFLATQTLWPETNKLYGHGYEISVVEISDDGKT